MVQEWLGPLLDAAPQLGVTLGAGSSPFVAAILFGRLITRGQHLRELEEVKTNAAAREAIIQAQLDRAIESTDNERKAKEVERERADKLATSLADITTEFGATAVHALQSLPQIGDGANGRT